MSGNPYITVIIPNYNHAAYLKQRIDSVANQTFQNFEIIILDDCSTDNSREIIESYRDHPAIKAIKYNETNSGSVFKQWKKGIEMASGEFVWIAESDDCADKNLLAELISVIKTDDHIGICFSGSHWIDENNEIKKDWTVYTTDFVKPGYEEIKNNLLKYNSIPNASAALMKKSLVKKYIDNILEYKWCGDWFLYVQMLQESNLGHVVAKLNSFRYYHNNTSSKYSKEGFGIYEGIKVLSFINFKKINFKFSEVLKISNEWIKKIRTIDGLKAKYNLFSQIIYFNVRYFKASYLKF